MLCLHGLCQALYCSDLAWLDRTSPCERVTVASVLGMDKLLHQRNAGRSEMHSVLLNLMSFFLLSGRFPAANLSSVCRTTTKPHPCYGQVVTGWGNQSNTYIQFLESWKSEFKMDKMLHHIYLINLFCTSHLMQDLIDHQLVPLHLAILSMKGFAITQNLVRQKPLQLSKVSTGVSPLLARRRFRWRLFFFTLKVFFRFWFGILLFLILLLLRLLRSARFCFCLCFDGPGTCTVIRSDWKLFAARAICGGTCLQRVTTWLSWTSSLVKSHRSFRSSVLFCLTILVLECNT